MERITQQMLERQLENLCRNLGLPYGHYAPCKQGESNISENSTNKTLPNGLDFDLAYGGVMVNQIDANGGTGVSTPFGSYRLTKREMFYMLYGLNSAFSSGLLRKELRK